MFDTPTPPSPADLECVREQLAALDGAGATEAEQIDYVARLERLKGSAAAAQARVTDHLAAARTAREAERGVPPTKRRPGVGSIVNVSTMAARVGMVMAATGEEGAAMVAGTTILGRLSSPAEIAEVIGFLASDAASYLTGATIAADAGRTAV